MKSETEQAKIEYVDEHLPYELLMLRHTHRQLGSGCNQLDWNAYFESFCLHGRNLYHFLLNHRERSKFVAADFTVAGHRAPRAGEMAAIVVRMNDQVAHLGRRTKDPAEKVDLSRCNKLCDWVEEQFPQFDAAMKPEYRRYWNPARAQLPQTTAIGPISFGPTGATHTSSLPVVYTVPPLPPRNSKS